MKTSNYVAGTTPKSTNRVAGRIRPKTPAGGKGSGNGTNPPTTDRPSGKPAPQKPCAAELELLAQRWEAVKAQAKQYYSEADRIEEQLIAAVGVGGVLQLSDGRRLRVKDNFRDAAGNAKLKAFTVAGIKLAEVEVK